MTSVQNDLRYFNFRCFEKFLLEFCPLFRPKIIINTSVKNKIEGFSKKTDNKAIILLDE